jgi:O-antigen biosynthesis protein
MKIAVINHTIPRPDKASGCKRLWEIMRILADHCVIDYFPDDATTEDSHYKSLLDSIKVNFNKNGYFSLINQFRKKQYDVIFFEFYSIASKYLNAAKRYQPQAVLVVDTVDIHFVRFGMEVESGLRKESSFLHEKKRELKAYRSCDICIAVSNEDGKLISKEGIQSVFTIPNIVTIVNRDIQRKRDPIIAFIGGFKHAPNIHAVIWFLDEIWDKIREKVPNAEFKIAGPDIPHSLLAKVNDSANTTYLGYIPNVNSLYDEAAVCIAPLTYGSGVKGKVNEAMAYGMPLVSTSIGVQGTELIDMVHCSIADTASTFADRVINIMKDTALQQQYTINAQVLAESTCGPRYAEQKLAVFLDHIRTISSSKPLPNTALTNNLLFIFDYIPHKILNILFPDHFIARVRRNFHRLIAH